MSNILVKILDKSILPAATIVVFKVIGMLLVIRLFNLDWYIRNYSTGQGFFSVRFIFDSPDSASIVNTFSSFAMFLGVFLICLVITLRAYFFHSTHQSPKVISRLAKINMLGVISDTKDIFSDAFVWFTALWISTIICLYSGLTGTSALWIAPASFALSLILTGVLLSDIEKEVSTQKYH